MYNNFSILLYNNIDKYKKKLLWIYSYISQGEID